uniref:Innexin n=1 Tax=Syphacia muris TaxID=451379 RepID=A0A0N5ABY8_9BILA
MENCFDVTAIILEFYFELLKSSKFLNNLKPKYDDDVIDRCNYLVTNTILFICALTVAAKQYVGEPLQCWVPAEFKSGWEKYIENYCFVENTYFVRMEDSIPTEDHLRSEKEIHYYQWVPFILMLQAFLFMIPRTVWKTFNWETGTLLTYSMNIFALSQLAYSTRSDGKKRVLNKDANTQPIVNRLNFAIKSNKLQRGYSDDPCVFIKVIGNKARLVAVKSFWRVYVTLVYIGCKMLNLLNICIQFALLNTLLGPEYKLWGFGILNDLIHGRQWNESGHFPRVTYCDINVREIGSVNRKTVQCVLMINMFNEKIFLGIWFWLFILGILTSVNLLYWIFTTTIPQFGRTFIRDSLVSKKVLVFFRRYISLQC